MTDGLASYSELTLAELERFGFSDPYDPRFIHAAVFGKRMIGLTQRWPDIDFSTLAMVNPDVVGWMHMAGSPIDYPVVAQHLDRGYYLLHNFSRDESPHGCVALAFDCARTMGGRNTVLYAHAMRDWSMFRTVRALCSQPYLDDHPTVDLMAVDGSRWHGRWFAAARYREDDPWPERTRFTAGVDFDAWLGKVREGNWLHAEVQLGEDARLLTCCTCANTPGPYGMRALFAVLEQT